MDGNDREGGRDDIWMNDSVVEVVVCIHLVLYDLSYGIE